MTPILLAALALIIPACIWFLVHQHIEWTEQEKAEKRIRDLDPLSDEWTAPIDHKWTPEEDADWVEWNYERARSDWESTKR